jgi:hypothetical protein
MGNPPGNDGLLEVLGCPAFKRVTLQCANEGERPQWTGLRLWRRRDVGWFDDGLIAGYCNLKHGTNRLCSK